VPVYTTVKVNVNFDPIGRAKEYRSRLTGNSSPSYFGVRDIDVGVRERLSKPSISGDTVHVAIAGWEIDAIPVNLIDFLASALEILLVSLDTTGAEPASVIIMAVAWLCRLPDESVVSNSTRHSVSSITHFIV
jgi:hypothetical protein